MRSLFILLFLLNVSTAFAEGNGKLQIHFIDVGQGDAALLISPEGETVLFDNGVANFCDMSVSYLQQLGIKHIDYHIASHYHDDHIGCSTEVLNAFPLSKAAYDRGSTYPGQVFTKYKKAVGAKRQTAIAGNQITLDQKSSVPITIKFIAANGAGADTSNENDLSLVSLIEFGKFHAVMGGDLSGYNTGDYKDIETTIADKVGTVEVYKVHHHCSAYSTNDKWLKATTPKVGIISASPKFGKKDYGHPTEECLERLHKGNVKAYWTEAGTGGDPDPLWDKVGRNIVVEADPTKRNFTVTYAWNHTDTYQLWETDSQKPHVSQDQQVNTYAWSKNSNIYHYADCKFVSNINPANLVKDTTPPSGKKLHENCH